MLRGCRIGPKLRWFPASRDTSRGLDGYLFTDPAPENAPSGASAPETPNWAGFWVLTHLGRREPLHRRAGDRIVDAMNRP